jgi:poly-gamma-glutamate system protein
MARELRKAGLIDVQEAAASLGGAEDRGIGVSERGREIIRTAIKRADLKLLLPASLEESVTKRIGLYTRLADGKPIRAYINIGGGSASTGPASIDQYFESGVIRSAQPKAFAVDSVMGHFLKEDIPALNISGIATIARRYGLPLAPLTRQPIGSGGVYNTASYRRWLAGFWVILILLLTYFVTRISGVASSFDKSHDSGARGRPSI